MFIYSRLRRVALSWYSYWDFESQSFFFALVLLASHLVTHMSKKPNWVAKLFNLAASPIFCSLFIFIYFFHSAFHRSYLFWDILWDWGLSTCLGQRIGVYDLFSPTADTHSKWESEREREAHVHLCLEPHAEPWLNSIWPIPSKHYLSCIFLFLYCKSTFQFAADTVSKSGPQPQSPSQSQLRHCCTWARSLQYNNKLHFCSIHKGLLPIENSVAQVLASMELDFRQICI